MSDIIKNKDSASHAKKMSMLKDLRECQMELDVY
jgi:hypothetical protein